MKTIQERLENYYIVRGVKLTEEQKKKIQNAVESVSVYLKNFIKDVIEPVWRMIKKLLDNIDWDKYIRYLKYKKRVNNRNKLYAKRKAKYGK